MPQPRSRSIRRPAVAGLFYPAADALCAAAAAELVHANHTALDRAWRGAIVPHAGWMCSGAIAGESIGTLRAAREAAGRAVPDVVVIFGAVHTPLPLNRAALASQERWQVPGGESGVAQEMAEELVAKQPGLFCFDDRFHVREHAVEVELPLVQRAWPDAMVLPIEVPLVEDGPNIGSQTAQSMARAGLDAVYLASSDLTHYGPAYEFVPAGIGLAALTWARENDARLLEVVTELRPERIVTEVRAHENACGGGAIAAMLAACRESGDAAEARVLRHANSFDVLSTVEPGQTPDNAVGYASVVVG